MAAVSSALLLGLIGAAALASGKRSAGAQPDGSLWSSLPDTLHGQKAQKLLTDAVLATGVSDWHIVTEERDTPAGRAAVTVVVSNAVRVAGARVSNVLYPNAQRLADQMGLLLPTTRIADMVHRAAVVRFGAEAAYVPLAPVITAGCPGGTVCRGTSREATLKLSQVVDGLVQGRTGLCDNEGKWFVLDHAVFADPSRSGIYGWWRSDGSLVQKNVTAHELAFADYSQCLRFAGPTTVIQPVGQAPFEMATKDVYTSATWSSLLVKGGPLPGYRHPGVEEIA